jgi:hypothetical protein
MVRTTANAASGFHQLFKQTVEGPLKLDVEKKLRQLGVRI